MMRDDTDWNLLARFAAGEVSPAERSTIERWLDADPSRRQLLDMLARDRRSAITRDAWNVDAAWQRVRPRLDQARDTSVEEIGVAWSDDHVVEPAVRPQVVRPKRRWVPVAAALVLVAGLGVVWPGLRSRATDGETLASNAVEREERTTTGERRDLTLSDGTRITLGVSSTLRVAAGYGATSREVALDGEAIFHVRHDEARPFIVRTGETITEDLGTSFVIRAYPKSGEVRVAVSEGAVSLQRAGANPAVTELHARDVAIVADTGAPLVRRAQDVTPLFAWAEGKLVFDNAPMTKVAEELSRWYDVDVRFGDPTLANRHLTATFAAESLEEVLRVIGITLDVRYERRGRVVTMYGNAPATGDARGVLSREAERRG